METFHDVIDSIIMGADDNISEIQPLMNHLGLHSNFETLCTTTGIAIGAVALGITLHMKKIEWQKSINAKVKGYNYASEVQYLLEDFKMNTPIIRRIKGFKEKNETNGINNKINREKLLPGWGINLDRAQIGILHLFLSSKPTISNDIVLKGKKWINRKHWLKTFKNIRIKNKNVILIGSPKNNYVAFDAFTNLNQSWKYHLKFFEKGPLCKNKLKTIEGKDIRRFRGNKTKDIQNTSIIKCSKPTLRNSELRDIYQTDRSETGERVFDKNKNKINQELKNELERMDLSSISFPSNDYGLITVGPHPKNDKNKFLHVGGLTGISTGSIPIIFTKHKEWKELANNIIDNKKYYDNKNGPYFQILYGANIETKPSKEFTKPGVIGLETIATDVEILGYGNISKESKNLTWNTLGEKN